MEELDGPKQTLNTSEKYLVESLSKRVLLPKILINVFKIKCSSYKVDVMCSYTLTCKGLYIYLNK